jgi:predicted HicB family RNase H-like nuclease
MLTNIMRSGDYCAEVGFDASARMLHGRVVGTSAVINFFSKNYDELEREFRDSVEDYLAWCRKDGVAPGKTWSGKLTLRASDEQRRRYAVAAALARKSVNAWMVDVLDRESEAAERAAIRVEGDPGVRGPRSARHG